MILRNLVTKEETPDRTPWWLLLLRLVIAGFFILALAGPILNAPAPSVQTGPLVLVIDDSWAGAQHWRQRRLAVEEAAAQAASADRELYVMRTASGLNSAIEGPMTGEEAENFIQNLTPSPLRANLGDPLARLETLDARLQGSAAAEIRWLTDNVADAGAMAFADALAERGTLTVFADTNAPKLRLTRAPTTGEQTLFNLRRLSANGAWNGAVSVTARDGREIANIPVEIEDGQRQVQIDLDLPLALRNEASIVRINGVTSAGAVQLMDARDRRALIGFLETADERRNNLLSGAHYIRQALAPYAAFIISDLEDLLTSDASVIVLNDIGVLRANDVVALEKWVRSGGVLIRFAGPVLAEAAQDKSLAIMPVPLRGGGRAFGGALTWDTPQPLDTFNADGPFAILSAPDDVFIRQQVLAQPGGQTTERTWAQLVDGTPLVTGVRDGAGVIALFHITATPEWSDLPLSGVFVDMLRRLAFLSSLGPDGAEENADTLYPPLRLLDGFGALRRAGDQDPALDFQTLNGAPSALATPGFYGAPEAAYALNATSDSDDFTELSLLGITKQPYEATPPTPLFPPLFMIVLALLLLDGLITLALAGRLRFGRAAAASTSVLFAIAFSALPTDTTAQPLDPALSQDAIEATLSTRLAYVATGDPAIDRLSEQALASLSRELVRRTAIEPAPPAKINLDTDDLSVYPFLYWPIAASAETPSETALENIENFMRFGGMILFDTRDDERAIGASSTPEALALQRILSQLDIPPLKQIDREHVLNRSFYLLGDLLGRSNNNPVWVQASESGANDGVTPFIIGGRDWAGAWAADQFGRPLRPMRRGGDRAREFAYRAGVNIVMVAFTGNYKSDQVHTPILLERLGQ